MPGAPPRVLRARIIAPVDQPPIDDGALLLEGEFVRWVGRWRDCPLSGDRAIEDLGEVVVVPGWVNAHAHLDYTRMAGCLPPPRRFSDWIQGILGLKAEWSYTDYADSWLAGARQLLRHGTTTVADIEAVPELLPEVWCGTPLRVYSFLELTSVRRRRDPRAVVAEAVTRAEAMPSGRSRAFLSPHALYSTEAGLVQEVSRVSGLRSWPWVMHVAESAEEFEMFQTGTGELYRWLARNGRDMKDCGGHSPVMHLARLGCLSTGLLAIHGNYLAASDARLLAEHGVHVVHCPRSHAYFQHGPFPWEALRRQGVNMALGTDSLASVRCSARETVELDLLAEMRCFARAHPGAAPDEVVRMATVNGARALGLAGRAGQLAPGSWADLAVLPLAPSLGNVSEAVLGETAGVARVMVGGDWVAAANLDADTEVGATRNGAGG